MNQQEKCLVLTVLLNQLDEAIDALDDEFLLNASIGFRFVICRRLEKLAHDEYADEFTIKGKRGPNHEFLFSPKSERNADS